MTVPGGLFSALASADRKVYKPPYSLRLDYSDSADYLAAPATTGNRNLWTIDFWHKRDRTGIVQALWSCGDYTGGNANAADYAYFNASDQLEVYIDGKLRLRTDCLFKDTTAHAHYAFMYDAANADIHKRLRIFINGTEIVAFANAARGGLASNVARVFNGFEVKFGYAPYVGYSGGYFTHIRGISGRACLPTELGLAFGDKSVTSPYIWSPAKWGGDWGVGWWFDISDPTSTTTLGYDRSGNANHATLYSMTVGGASTCVLKDVPYAYDDGVVGRGNYATLADGSYQRFGALDIVNNITAHGTIPCTLYDCYWEVTANQSSCSAGAFNSETWTIGTMQSVPSGSTYGFRWTAANGLQYTTNGSSWSAVQSISGSGWFPLIWSQNGTASQHSMSINFGQRAFTYSVPGGCKTLCALNVVPLVVDPRRGFQASNRIATGSAFTQSLLMSTADIVWIKCRSSALNHMVTDNMQGAGKYAPVNLGTGNPQVTDAQAITTLTNPVAGGTAAILNTSGQSYFDLFWKAATSYGVGTTQWIGDGTSNRTVSNPLSAAPEFVMVQNLTDGGNFMWSTGNTGQTYFQTPETPAVESNTSSPWGTGGFSSNVSFMVSNAANTNGKSYVAWLFRSIAGFSRIIPYNGISATPHFLWCGFRPKFVILVRHTGAAASHAMLNGDIDWAGAVKTYLTIDGSAAEATSGSLGFLFHANGITITNTDFNVAGSKYVVLAFAETPFYYANAGVGEQKLRDTVNYGPNADNGPSYNFTFAANTNDVNLRTMANAAGYENALGPATVTITINSGVVIGSTSSSTPALDTGTWPSGTTISVVNNGKIVGKGGLGGNGDISGNNGGNGANGGDAFKAQFAITMTNNGWIAGGGGGGGGGATSQVYPRHGGGGGGGAGSNSGAGTTVSTNWGPVGGTAGDTNGQGGTGAGANGTSVGSTPGGGIGVAGTVGTNQAVYPSFDISSGGGGGGFGAAGGDGAGYSATGGTGGAAGKAVVGNSFITWSVTGTRYGAIT